jgi:hypothetical protein
MIPAAKPADRLFELVDGPEQLAAQFCDPRTSPDAIQKRAMAWMTMVARPIRDLAAALQAIAWAKAMPLLAKTFGAAEYQALEGFLSSLSADVDEQVLPDLPLLHQLLAGELAWTLAVSSKQAGFAARQEKSGRAAVSLGLNQILDRQGMLPAEHIRLLRPMLACWARCRALAANLPGGGLGPRPEQRYQRFVRNALRCSRPDGRAIFADEESGGSGGRSTTAAWGSELFEAVLTSGVDEADRQLAALALPKLSPAAVARPPKKSAELPPPSIFWEEGAIAVMRRGWNREDERLAVLYSGQNCELELVASGRLVATGTWRFEVSLNGQQLDPVSDWETVCWYTDSEVDYLEIEIGLTGGVKLQRQIVFARDDRFLILADAVLSTQRGDWEYRGVLPLTGGVEFHGASESREGLLAENRVGKPGHASTPGRPLAHVLPLGMPEWRTEPTSGELRAIQEGLELRHGIVMQPNPAGMPSPEHGFLAPIFIDLDRGRFRRRMTWRRLTVAEGLQAVPADKAVGFRIAIGSEQWLFYRSLTASSNRTVLGHNLSSGSLIARFGKEGAVSSIVEIE